MLEFKKLKSLKTQIGIKIMIHVVNGSLIKGKIQIKSICSMDLNKLESMVFYRMVLIQDFLLEMVIMGVELTLLMTLQNLMAIVLNVLHMEIIIVCLFVELLLENNKTALQQQMES